MYKHYAVALFTLFYINVHTVYAMDSDDSARIKRSREWESNSNDTESLNYTDLNEVYNQPQYKMFNACIKKNDSNKLLELLNVYTIKNYILQLAVEHNQSVLLKILLDKCGSADEVNCTDIDGFSLIHNAIKNNSLNCLSVLIASPMVDINIPDDCIESLKDNEDMGIYSTPLHYAAVSTNIELLTVLLTRNDLKLNIQDNDGYTPLHKALEYHNCNAVRLLLLHDDIAIDIKADDNITPWDLAQKMACKKCIDGLLQKYPGTLLQSLGDTPLGLAINQDHFKVISKKLPY
jgi:ankyrin repeat protein